MQLRRNSEVMIMLSSFAERFLFATARFLGAGLQKGCNAKLNDSFLFYFTVFSSNTYGILSTKQ